MNELVKIRGNDVFTDSMVIAVGTGNQHKNVKELIQKYEDDMKDFGTLSVLNGESTGGRPAELFLLNEEQATFLMTLLRNSKKVVSFKKELVRQFYAMRKLLLQKESPVWKEARKLAKEVRKKEETYLEQFCNYAAANGSRHPETYYKHFSSMANRAAGIPDKQRDTAPQEKLAVLCVVEDTIGVIIHEGITGGKPYKAIFQACKEKVEGFAALSI